MWCWRKASKKKELGNTVVHRNFETKTDDSYCFGENTYTGEAVFTPLRCPTHLKELGIFKCPSNDNQENKSRLTIFWCDESLMMVHWPLFILPRKNRVWFHGKRSSNKLWWFSSNLKEKFLSSESFPCSMSLSRTIGKIEKSKEANSRSSIKNCPFWNP